LQGFLTSVVAQRADIAGFPDCFLSHGKRFLPKTSPIFSGESEIIDYAGGMVIPIILSGGTVARLWPVSRASHPKPFMKLPDGESLFCKTFSRALAIDGVLDTGRMNVLGWQAKTGLREGLAIAYADSMGKYRHAGCSYASRADDRNDGTGI